MTAIISLSVELCALTFCFVESEMIAPVKGWMTDGRTDLRKYFALEIKSIKLKSETKEDKRELDARLRKLRESSKSNSKNLRSKIYHKKIRNRPIKSNHKK